MKIQFRQITNGNVYIDGNSMMGKVSNVDMPEVQFKTSDRQPLGMFGVVQTINGLDKMEATFVFESIFDDVAVKVANPKKRVAVQVRSSVEDTDSSGMSSELALVTHLGGTFTQFPLGKIKQGDNAELNAKMSVSYVKQILEGKDLIEIDVMANIYKVGGEDILATYRKNIGG